MTSIGIIDLGIGNTGSLRGALFNEGYDPCLVKTAEDVEDYSHLLLPGVGSFFEGMRRLELAGFSTAIRKHVSGGKPLMGICLGMQMLASYGFEGGHCEGLNLIPGTVEKLPSHDGFRLPHVGWNGIDQTQQHPLFSGVKPNVDFYFVHSYAVTVVSQGSVLSTTDHGGTFTSSISAGSVIGVQFHPEKSQKNGLKILDNFCQWDGNA